LFASIYKILEKDKRYKFPAYPFILAALEATRQQTGKTKHVTGQELCEGFKTLAINEYGIMAKAVLESWGIISTDDIGEIVFNLIEAEMLSKTEEDTKKDFHNVFDFDKIFNKDYHFHKNNNQEDA
jgi:uncharacterized repeat protein (TIGR04138 family)